MKSKRALVASLSTLLLFLIGNEGVFAGYQGGINVYEYVESKPTLMTDPIGKYPELTYSMSKGTIVAKDIDNKTGKVKKEITINNVFSGKGKYKNDPDYAHLKNSGPIPPGTYCLKKKKWHTPPKQYNMGDWWWYPITRMEKVGLFGDDSQIPVTDPDTGKTIMRSQFYLHTGRISDGCVTVWSTEPPILDSDIELPGKGKKKAPVTFPAGFPNPKYPGSADYAKLRSFIDGADDYKDPKTCKKCKGVIKVQP